MSALLIQHELQSHTVQQESQFTDHMMMAMELFYLYCFYFYAEIAW